jgi:malonyl-CoA O-methyltransferase
MSPLDPNQVRRAFARAAAGYEASAVLQREVETRLLERVAELAPNPACVLDVGTGPGRASAWLKRRYPKAQVIALDAALPMLALARRRASWWRPFRLLAGDAAALPLAEHSVDLLFSNLCIQWCEDLPALFDEWRRVLRPGGVLLLSSFGPDTLRELRSAWAAADGGPHVNRFADLAQIGDALLGAGFRDPVVDRDLFTLSYADARQLMRELKAIGAGNADRARRRGLTGRAVLARVLAHYEALRHAERLPATYEVVYAQALAPELGQPRRGGGGEIASVALASLRGSRVRR